MRQTRQSFSLALMAAYLGVFHLWQWLPPSGVLATGLAATAVLTIVLAINARRGYFLSRWDLAIHAAIILDILLEGVLLPVHDDYGFYLCATAFAAVLWGYRAVLSRKRPAPAQPAGT